MLRIRISKGIRDILENLRRERNVVMKLKGDLYEENVKSSCINKNV